MNLLLILSFFLTYADSHGLLPPAAVTEGRFLNSALSWFSVPCFLIFLIPYGLGVVILTVLDYVKVRKNAPSGSRPRLRYLIAALLALLFTLAAKCLFLVDLSVHILYQDTFHF
jgi:hypothetical protein